MKDKQHDQCHNYFGPNSPVSAPPLLQKMAISPQVWPTLGKLVNCMSSVEDQEAY